MTCEDAADTQTDADTVPVSINSPERLKVGTKHFTPAILTSKGAGGTTRHEFGGGCRSQKTTESSTRTASQNVSLAPAL